MLIDSKTTFKEREIAVLLSLTPRRVRMLASLGKIQRPYTVASIQGYIESLRKEIRHYKHSQPRKKRNLFKRMLVEKPKPLTLEEKIACDMALARMRKEIDAFVSRLREVRLQPQKKWAPTHSQEIVLDQKELEKSFADMCSHSQDTEIVLDQDELNRTLAEMRREMR
jgi:hypothetical protein